MKTWSSAEAIVLRHFFTNVDRDVYCATDALPMALWAYLEGGYSRSQVSMRERFLAIFEEMREKDPQNAPSVERLAESISTGHSPELDGALAKASSFMSKWAVEYGHNSLKDSSVDRFALENVSQRAAKLLEHSSLGAFQEKSTRYLDFSRDELVLPLGLTESSFGEEARWQASQLMKAYRDVLSRLQQWFRDHLARADFKTEAAWRRTADAKAFDVARHLLPSSVKTSLGATFPSRETERHISALLASPHEEIRGIAEQMLAEATSLNPGLLRHVKPNPYLERTSGAVADLARNLATPGRKGSAPTSERDGAEVELVWISPEIETLALASCLRASEISDLGLAEWIETVRSGGQDLRDRVATAALEPRGPHDDWPREFAVGQICFDMELDFGAWRDLQRHRVGLQMRARPTAEIGFLVPPELRAPGLEAALDIYRHAMERASEFHSRLFQARPQDAEYATALGHMLSWSCAMDLRQWAYIVELRSGPSGHRGYREVAHRMARLVLPYVPALAPHLRVDWSGETDRRQAEERTQEKLAALAGNR
ncbi:MAG: FAD-dependent thymidylate synthase [Fibrobacteria bacterium]|nr:FAD-dependent thymidylate synthase [Fibrobacteria bacterium]